MSLTTRQWLSWLVFGCGIAALVAALVLVVFSDLFRLEEADEIAINESRAETILQAIARYQQDHEGPLPEQLQDFVPGYLDSIPATFRGAEFGYWPSSLDGYLLCFDCPNRHSCACCYAQRWHSWECSFGAE